MEYKQVEEISRAYEYGNEKEFPNREEALKEIKNLELKKKTELAMLRLYQISETEIIEEEEGKIFLKIAFKIPIII